MVAILKMMSVSDATYKQAANQAETRNCCNYVSNSNFSVHTAWPLHQQHTFLMSPAAGSLALLCVQQAVYNVQRLCADFVK